MSYRYYESSNHHREFRRRHRSGLVMGVCAGIADYFGFDRMAVRIVALLCLWLFTIPTALIYLLLGWLGSER